jgi:signal transduction histidine kinase
MITWRQIRNIKSLDLQAKVILILIAVIFPISFILGLVQSKVTAPILDDEIRQVGISFAQNLGGQIETKRLLLRPNAAEVIDDQIQRMIYAQPSVIRVDVIKKNNPDNKLFFLASSVVDEGNLTLPVPVLVDQMVVEKTKEDNVPVWSILFPVKNGNEKANIHVIVSVRLVSAVQSVMLKINLIAAFLSTISLILMLSYFLRRAIENEKQLKVAQMSNEVLSEKLQGIQQELIHTEKLAVMGQLTASFAHEIGTPLNAIGGHMQLLDMDLSKAIPEAALKGAVSGRIGVITGQLHKIEEIVKGFLQTTKKPILQDKTITPVQVLIERVIELVMPTLQRHQISFGQEFKAEFDLVEVVPLEVEQVVLNLVNNAVDSMKEKSQLQQGKVANALWIRTYNDVEKKWLVIEIKDTGMGITDENLKRIFKPFFTTKSAGEGHGLGLSICQQFIRSYGGEILVESKVDSGTKIMVQLPRKVERKNA